MLKPIHSKQGQAYDNRLSREEGRVREREVWGRKEGRECGGASDICTEKRGGEG